MMEQSANLSAQGSYGVVGDAANSVASGAGSAGSSVTGGLKSAGGYVGMILMEVNSKRPLLRL
jgi:hypothetical protein